MSYIGRSPQIGGYHKLDQITTDGSASYTMQLNSANFTPESANHLIVSVNGVIQAPTDSFTVSSSTITFASSLSASDTIDFIMALGNTLDIGTPSDGTISASKLATTSITGQTAETSANDSDSLLIYDDSATALRKMTRANFLSGVGGSNTPAFFAKQGSGQTIGSLSWTKLSIDTEIFDSDGKFDTTTNRFTPTIAGKYFCFGQVNIDSGSTNTLIQISMYKNGSQAYMHVDRFPSTNDISVNISVILDLDTDDYVEAYARHSKGSNANILSDSSFFGAYKLIGA